MFWVALATAIMMLSGEGDDTRAILLLLTQLRQAVTANVVELSRREQALKAIARVEEAFKKHREELRVVGACIEAVDRRYGATQHDYDECAAGLPARRAALSESLSEARSTYEEVLQPAERARIADAVAAVPEAWVLDPSLDMAAKPASSSDHFPRFRGLEGVVSQRHLTLPRNVVGLLYGPLGPATFGQRYPSKVIDGGTSYTRARWAVPDGSPHSNSYEWFTRFGVRFGLFDDFEAGALFLPFQLAPDFRFDSVLVFLTQQFRFEGFDVAARFSFQTPGDIGWAISPGVVVSRRSRKFGFQAGVVSPMELGSFKEPKAPRFAVFAPLRLTYNLLPSLFVSADSGLAYEDVADEKGLSVPLGVGAGYSWLVGKRLLEFTSSFTWDRFLLPAHPSSVESFQPRIFRMAFGASLYFQAL